MHIIDQMYRRIIIYEGTKSFILENKERMENVSH